MSAAGRPAAVRAGRPRSEKSRQAILAAATELMLDSSLGSISMDAIAKRAGASKATIYRWWPCKELLAVDALLLEWDPGEAGVHDTGPLRQDLLSLVRPWARQLAAKPYGRVVVALLNKAHSDPQFAREYRDRFVEPRRQPARTIFTRATERGELRAGLDLEIAVDLLFGPFYHRHLHGHAPVTDRFARSVVDLVVAAVGVPGPGVSRTRQPHP